MTQSTTELVDVILRELLRQKEAGLNLLVNHPVDNGDVGIDGTINIRQLAEAIALEGDANNVSINWERREIVAFGVTYGFQGFEAMAKHGVREMDSLTVYQPFGTGSFVLSHKIPGHVPDREYGEDAV